MEIKNLHLWNFPSSIDEAKIIQEKISRNVVLKSYFESIDEIETVAGCDVSYSKDESEITGAVSLFDFKKLSLIEKVIHKIKTTKLFPYIPGLLSFREIPIILETLKKLKTAPDLFLIDGQGIAHPKRLGIATHLGIILDKPTIGCAKTKLYGECDEPPPGLKGAYTFIKNGEGTLIGFCIRTKKFTKPLFVSQGYKIGLDLSAEIVMSCCKNYRIPEPLRIAHSLSKKEMISAIQRNDNSDKRYRHNRVVNRCNHS